MPDAGVGESTPRDAGAEHQNHDRITEPHHDRSPFRVGSDKTGDGRFSTGDLPSPHGKKGRKAGRVDAGPSQRRTPDANVASFVSSAKSDQNDKGNRVNRWLSARRRPQETRHIWWMSQRFGCSSTLSGTKSEPIRRTGRSVAKSGRLAGSHMQGSSFRPGLAWRMIANVQRTNKIAKRPCSYGASRLVIGPRTKLATISRIRGGCDLLQSAAAGRRCCNTAKTNAVCPER